MSNDRRKVECNEHGVQVGTVVCRHIAWGLDDGNARGFWTAPDDEARPTAWCDACEDFISKAGDNESAAIAEQAEWTLLCASCYDSAQKQNGYWPFVDDPSRALNQCRENIGALPRSFSWWDRFTYLKPSRPMWSYTDKLKAHFGKLPQIWERGRVTWGCTVQANNLLFEPGPHDCPGEVVYVVDPEREVDLVELARVASALFDLKGTNQPDTVFAEISHYLADELVRVFGLPVPELISPELPCAVSTTFFMRRHLPNGILSQGAFPILVTDDRPQVVSVLPSRYWPEELRSHWVR